MLKNVIKHFWSGQGWNLNLFGGDKIVTWAIHCHKSVDLWRRLKGGRTDVLDVDVDVVVVVIIAVVSDLRRMRCNKLFGIIEREREREIINFTHFISLLALHTTNEFEGKFFAGLFWQSSSRTNFLLLELRHDWLLTICARLPGKNVKLFPNWKGISNELRRPCN